MERTELEVLERRVPGGPTGKKPLLFVHGYWQAAWCWDEHLMPDLAGRGYDCFAVSLTGHGGSEGKIRGQSIRDNVADVYSTMRRFDDPPVIIGHSMGGYTVQHYLAKGHPAAGAVLVAPVPRSGAWRATWRVASRYPAAFVKANLLWDVGVITEDPGRAHQILFGPGVSREEADPFTDRWERASYRTYLNLLFSRPEVPSLPPPVLVIGGSDDFLFDVSEWRSTADDWSADLVVIEGAGHQIMLEPAWPRLADEIDRFAEAL